MDGFTIESDRIATAASGVEQVGERLQAEINTMEGLLGDITSGWQSTSAAPRFATAMQGYLDEARALSTALLSHGAGLAATGRVFDQAEEAVSASTPGVVA